MLYNKDMNCSGNQSFFGFYKAFFVGELVAVDKNLTLLC